ncbi:divergent polysaccharide deacetylase family protein [Poseidonibacter antarcticus]|uniref:divergent polysaccharide deacetylase family protein n=1 Tax=Poseidonibacter antarcticus TaxID=2478538 RepID=UPI001968BC62|nr:divergent polysaccharide deacetylase family protein [Poseidonibacter antarcticus]
MTNESSNKSINNNILKSESNDIKKYQDKKLDEYFEKIKTPKIETPKKKPEEKFEEVTEESKKDFIDKESKQIKTVKKVKQNEEKKKIVVKEVNKNDKPKLIIILDDITTSRQKKAILDIGYPVTMSFLPPQKGHIHSAKVAQDIPVYMIHFPMQASPRFKSTEITTLNINDSYARIESIVKNLRKLYPNAIYTNNHTGSVFTQNDKAMDKLFKALKKYNFVFVDSRTSAKSVAKKYAKKYSMPYIVRNTFLDNKRDYVYIQNQLKKAIKIAKKRGYAIAIGHPHSMTIKVLKESKSLLKDVQAVYINKLPYL